jgi:putative phosphoesterase
MRLGLVSDVHANLVALEAVLGDMPDVDALVCAGDVVGYNPWPGECVDRVREVAATTVVGNHDRNVGSPARYRGNEMAYAGLRLARERLSDDQRTWLEGLPERTHVADDRVLLVHSHPDPARQGMYVYPADFGRVASVAAEEGAEALVLGHTHVQHAAREEGTLVVNPGSVGQPRDGDPRAAYAVLTATPDGLDVTLSRVEYDVDRVREAAAEAGLPERTGTRLLRGE